MSERLSDELSRAERYFSELVRLYQAELSWAQKEREEHYATLCNARSSAYAEAAQRISAIAEIAEREKQP
jgi:hypothetical protein